MTFKPRVRNGQPNRYCSLRCSTLDHYRRNPSVVLTASQVFEQRVMPRLVAAGECLLWPGAKNSMGYGQISVGRRTFYVHRVAWAYYHGRALVQGENVLHRCDTPLCARREHLFIGTQADNLGDAAAKGRIAYGERNPRAKLTAAKVEEIRWRYAAGAGQKELATAYGVSRQTIQRVVTGVDWRRVGGPITKRRLARERGLLVA